MLFRAKATLCLLEEKLSQKAYRINDEFIDERSTKPKTHALMA
jgi:hypothetical protein